MKENDLKWRGLVEKKMQQAENFQWGLYRNTVFEMGDFLRKEKKLINALQHYFQVLYLDTNGPKNSPMMDGEFQKEQIFDLNLAFIAPGVVDRVKKIIKKLGISFKEVEKIYYDAVSPYSESFKTLKSSEESWREIKKEIK